MGFFLPIVASALIGGAASIAGGRAQKKAADKAADSSERATRMQIEENRRQFDTTRADFAPWRDAGRAALGRITEGLKAGTYDMSGWQFEKDPGYDFRLREGQKVLENSAAARGGLLSGRTGKNLLAYGQDFASGEYGAAYARGRQERADRFNREAVIAGVGQQATGSTAAAGDAATGRITGAIGNNANILAQSAIRGGEAQAGMYGNIAGAANQGIENMLFYRMMGAA